MENLKAQTCCWAFMILYLTFVNSVYGAESLHRIRAVGASEVDQKHRPSYHFQPQKNWINDPNGPMYYNGFYHLFYQHNPYGPIWGNMAWGHSYSTDLINWIPLEPAIVPSESFDINGAWSGSITMLPGNKPVILYTGIDEWNREVQNFAYPKNLSDPLLREWIKPDYNPVMEPTSAMDPRAFRDPTTAWLGEDGLWRVTIGHRIDDTGVALLYWSRDFQTWTKASNPLHSVAGTGMWECPDFFPVLMKGKNGLDTSVNGNLVKHVLKVSLLPFAEIYSVGKYSTEEDRYVPDETSVDNYTGLRLDYGNFYASKTFYDGKKKRRILWGWVMEADTVKEATRKGWAGMQAIPRSLWLDSNGEQLVQWPVEELEVLRGQSVQLNDVSLALGSLLEVEGITAAQADIEVTFGLPSLENAEPFDPSWVDAAVLCAQKNASVQGGLGPFGLLTMASENIEEYTAVFFHVFKTQNKPVVLMCAGGNRSSLGTDLSKPSYGGFVNVDIIDDGSLSLRILIDNSIVESFAAGGKTCIICRVYPTLANGPDAHLFLFNNGAVPVTVNKLVGWSMGKPLMN